MCRVMGKTQIKPGFCKCGCGRRPRRAKRTNKLWGLVKGEPKPYIAGHRSGKFTPAPKRPFKTHGMSGTPVYRAFRNALYRCTNQELPCWQFYGGRGIQFLFESVEQWFAELGPRPSSEHSVDRVDCNGDYCPGNVRWALRDVQQTNKRGQWHVWTEEVLPDFDNDLMPGDIQYKLHATLCF